MLDVSLSQDTDNLRRGTSRRRSSSRSRSRSGSRSRDRHGGSSRGSGGHRSHRRRGDRSRSRERSHRRDRDRSRSRSHRRSRSRSGSRSRREFSKRSSAERFEMEDRALASSASSTAARALAVSAAAATVSQASALSVSAATPSSTSAPPPGVSAALAAARAAAVRSGLMSVEALNAPPPQIPNSLPSYYNPTAVNALKYTEQMQKRKLLWKKPQQDEVAAETEAPNPQPNSTCAKVWEKMTFAQDDDGKMTAKFRKLMGIRGDPPPPTDKPDPAVNPLLKQQEKLFQDLDQQYEAARVSTHTHRGVGLGYSSQMAAFFQQTNLNTK
uniref:Putative transcriptional coactivator caper rrm superfamily n=1 Tax=Rhipicephalus pulchellus TaxID=72859 RepID=L7LYJ6_RHIPC